MAHPHLDQSQLDVLTVSLDPPDGLAHVARVVGLLRGRGHPVTSLRVDLGAAAVTVVLTGPGLHGGDPAALVVRRLQRLPGVLGVALDRVTPPESGRAVAPGSGTLVR